MLPANIMRGQALAGIQTCPRLRSGTCPQLDWRMAYV